ncbi:MAG: hypothetical protein L6R39_007663, partial [Caloplaca ligustica]
MLVPNPLQADNYPAPPPYTPSSRGFGERYEYPTSTELDPIPHTTANGHQFSSAAAYFQERPCTLPYLSCILEHALVFSSNTTRDDLLFPQPADQYESRGVSLEDWNTFVNYLFPVDVNPTNGKGRPSRPRSNDVLRDRDRVEAVLAEWHEGFFGPRGIRIQAHIPSASCTDTMPPPPFTSTANVGFYPEAGSSANQGAPVPSEPSQPPTPVQPRVPPQPPLPYGQSPLQWAHNNTAGTRHPSGPLGWLLSGVGGQQQPGLHEGIRSGGDRHGHEVHERRGRSPSSSSSSSSSSASSIASISSSDFLAAEADEIRRSLALFRQNLAQKAELKAAVRQFRHQIRQNKRQHHD